MISGGRGVSTLFGCRPMVVKSYVSILAAANTEKKKSIIDISRQLGESSTNVGQKVNNLRERGFVYCVFGGSKKYICLTDEGKELVKTFGEVSVDSIYENVGIVGTQEKPVIPARYRG